MKLPHRIIGAYILVIAVAIALMAITSRYYINVVFDHYTEGYRGVFYDQWEYLLISYYSNQESWAGVENLVTPRGRRGMTQYPGREFGAFRGMLPGEELLLADNEGVVVLDLQNERTGEKLPNNLLEKGTSLFHNDRKIGTLIIMPETARTAMTMEEQFSHSVTLAIFWGGVGALLAATLLGLLITGQITRPLTLLTESVRRFSRRDFRHRVELKRKDEINDLARAFNLMADSIEKNETIRSNLVTDVSHELRTPLTILQGNFEALLDGSAKPTPELLSSLYDEVLRLGRLAHDLEAINLAEAGKLPLNYHEAGIADLLGRVAATFQHEAGDRNIDFKVDINQNLDSWFLDEDRVMQVLINLLANAFKYTPDYGKITLRAKAESELMMVELQDSGPGIDEKDLPYIFDRFYKARKGRGVGSGLGLSIAKSIVEAHGGTIKAQKPPQGGSVFTFCLPSNREAILGSQPG